MNYNELLLSIQSFLEDNGTELTTALPEIITQAENMIFARLPNLPCYRQEITGNFVIGTKEYDVANARMIRQIAITEASGDVTYLKHRIDSYLRDYVPNATTAGVPFM